MTPGALLREALAAARASLVPTVLVALVVAATCLAAVTTVGRQAAAESALAQQLAGAEARTLTVTATGDGDVLTPAVLDALNRTAAPAGTNRTSRAPAPARPLR